MIEIIKDKLTVVRLIITELINDIPNILSEGIDRDRAKEEILTSPIYKDLIISSNAKTTAMQLVIKKNESLSNALKQRNLLLLFPCSLRWTY